MLDSLTDGRSRALLDLEHLPAGANAEPASPSTWLVNGSRARPLTEPEPARLGQARPGPQRLHDGRQSPFVSNGSHAARNPSPTVHRRRAPAPSLRNDDEHAMVNGPPDPPFRLGTKH